MISRFEHDQEDEYFLEDVYFRADGTQVDSRGNPIIKEDEQDSYIEPILPIIAVIGIYLIAALLGLFSWMGVQ